MKKFDVRYTDNFQSDLTEIVLYILEQSQSIDIARRFYEKYHPYDGSPEYYRIYFGNYTIYYVIENEMMDVRRMLWSGSDVPERIEKD